MKNNPALPGGLLKSKPTWPKTFGCSATSAFLFLATRDVRNHYPVSNYRRGLPMGLLLLIILIVLLMGGLPTWGYSRSWGYGPSGGLGLVLVVVVVLLLLGHIPIGF
jgi:hypothetical protein